MKTIVALSDLHCGALTGLTPPDHWASEASEHGKQQRLIWNWYHKSVPKNADAMLCIGDCIDGKGGRSGSSEEATADRIKQAAIAAECIAAASPKRVVLCYGTGYHTGAEEDWEDIVALNIKEKGIPVEIGAHETVNVNGLRFDLKHKVGSSQIPHGRHTAGSRERIWNIQWFLRGQRPLADILLRAHVHYFQYAGEQGWMQATLPCLQGLGSKYGARECSGTVDIGFLVFRVHDRGAARRGRARLGAARHGKAMQGKVTFDWEPVLFDLRNVAASEIVV